MKPVGELLKAKRLSLGWQLDQVASKTKIGVHYLEALEENQVRALPSAAFVKGFIRSYSQVLGLDAEKMLAIYRRDFDENPEGKIIPRGILAPLTQPVASWRPQTIPLILAAVIAVLVIGYVGYQLKSVWQGPTLVISAPESGVVTSQTVEVIGRTDPDAAISINSQPVSVDLSGAFRYQYQLQPGDNTLVIAVKSPLGKEKTEIRTITRQDPAR